MQEIISGIGVVIILLGVFGLLIATPVAVAYMYGLIGRRIPRQKLGRQERLAHAVALPIIYGVWIAFGLWLGGVRWIL